jgi:hypothetical protein
MTLKKLREVDLAVLVSSNSKFDLAVPDHRKRDSSRKILN